MTDKYTGREIISPVDKLTDEETQTIRNEIVDFLAQICVIKNQPQTSSG
jgi:hypothetical protein